MVDKDSEQNIDQQVSTSPIDQITKIADSKPKAKVKNPKRVAAGKKLSEYNKKAKEQQKIIQENDEEENQKQRSRDKVENDGDNPFLPKTSSSSIIALIGLGLTAIDLFLRYKSQRAVSKTADFDNVSNNNSELINLDQKIKFDEADYEVSKSFAGME